MSFLLYLAKNGLFREEDIPEISRQAEKVPGGLDEVLEKGGMTGKQIELLKKDYYGIETKDLAGHKVPVEVLKYIPEANHKHFYTKTFQSH